MAGIGFSKDIKRAPASADKDNNYINCSVRSIEMFNNQYYDVYFNNCNGEQVDKVQINSETDKGFLQAVLSITGTKKRIRFNLVKDSQNGLSDVFFWGIN